MSYLLVKNAAQLVSPEGHSARFGKDMSHLRILSDAAVLIDEEKIIFVGTSKEAEIYIKENLPPESKVTRYDASGKTILPGFVDSHTHFIFGGYREHEFNLRLEGASYMDIMQAGGGIAYSIAETTAAGEDELYELGWRRLQRMTQLGITTVEGKTGYGEDTASEDKMLRVMERLVHDHPIEIAKTYMGAHAVPRDYPGGASAYIDYIIAEGLPMAAGRADYCDVFCETDVFELEDSERLLLAAREHGFKLKLHADEIVQLGGAGLAAKLKATSADHLLKSSDQDLLAMRDAGTVATLLPCTAFSLKEDYARGRFMIDSGLAVALASDLNPGSCYTQSVPLIIALATIYMGLSIEECITALTLNGAAAIDRADSIGSLEIGKQADLILLDAPNYRHLSYHFAMNLVDTVIKKGKILN